MKFGTLVEICLFCHIWQGKGQKSALRLVKLAGFKVFLLKTNEDLAPQSRQILQTLRRSLLA